MKRNKKGFTLVEIIIVIALLVVIAGMFSLNMISSLNKQRIEENQNIVAQILSAANTYVSVNPEEVENLYNGYGYVDIPIGNLRDAGLLSEELKDSETGERIPDDEKVRVKLELGDLLDITFPADTEQDAWKFVADNKNVPYDENGSVEKWCEVNASNPLESNVFEDLIVDPTKDYANQKSRMYMLDKDAKMFDGGADKYFGKGDDDFKLEVESCDVNPSKVGTYTVTYKYYDPKLKTEKTVKRTVYVDSSNKDIISFAVEINGGTPIVRGTRDDVIPIKIVETYRDGSKTIETIVGKLGSEGLEYSLADFDTSTVTTKDATVNRTKPNSDGSLPTTQKTSYQVIPDEYDLTYDIGYTLNRRESSFPDRVQKYNNDVARLQTKKRVKFQYSYESAADGMVYARPSGTYSSFGGNLVNGTNYSCSGNDLCRRGYTFKGWYIVPTTCMTTYPYPDATKTHSVAIGDTPVYNDTLMTNLCDHTVRAQWEANTYTVTFNANGRDGVVNPSSKTVTYDSTYGDLPIPTRMGYTFLGWFTDPVGGTQITSSTEVDIIANQNLYAHWKANNYTVYFDFAGGLGSPSSKVVTFDSTYGPLPTPYKPGWSESSWCSGGCTCTTTYYYVFGGYYLNGQRIDSSTQVRTPYDHTLTASFSLSSSSSTYCPPPPPPPAPAPSSSNNKPSGGGGGSSDNRTSCTPSCGNACSGSPSESLAAGQDCTTQAQAGHDESGLSWEEYMRGEGAALHEKAKEHYTDYGQGYEYDSVHGNTFSSAGAQLNK